MVIQVVLSVDADTVLQDVKRILGQFIALLALGALNHYIRYTVAKHGCAAYDGETNSDEDNSTCRSKE